MSGGNAFITTIVDIDMETFRPISLEVRQYNKPEHLFFH